jgi:hypothetical protein
MQLIEVDFTKLILKEILVVTSGFFLKQKEQTQRWRHVLGAAGLNSGRRALQFMFCCSDGLCLVLGTSTVPWDREKLLY